MIGRSASENIEGRGGNDTICAGTGNNTVRGGTGEDNVVGGSGKDELIGDAGKDLLLGQAGIRVAARAVHGLRAADRAQRNARFDRRIVCGQWPVRGRAQG